MMPEEHAPVDVDRGDAERFIAALAGSLDSPVTFQTFTDPLDNKAKKVSPDGRPWPRNARGEVYDPLARWLHGTLAQHWDELVRLNRSGAGIFVMVNAGDGQGRSAKNVRALRALFVEDDGGTLAPSALGVAPSIVVQSRHGLHVYWRLKPGEPVEQFTRAQEALARALQTDPVKDLPRVLRVAGFVHRKDPAAPYRVKLLQVASAEHTIAEIVEGNGASLEAPKVGRRQVEPPSLRGTVTRLHSISEAVAEYNRAHGFDLPGSPSVCPVCNDSASFHELPGSPGRWYCFSTDHPDGCGIRGANGHHGDFLDLDVYASRATRMDLLRSEGLLPPIAVRVTPAPTPGVAPTSTPEALPEEPPPDLDLEDDGGNKPKRRPLTDAGNAERFVARHRGIVRYAHKWDCWLIWDGARWARDLSRQVYGLAIEVARRIHKEAEGLDPDTAKTIYKHAFASEKRDRLEAMLALARTMPPVAILSDDLDRDPELLVVPNGDLSLRTGALLPHDPARLLSRLAPVPFDPDARCPAWLAVLARVMPDSDVRAYLARAVGYTLTGSVQEHALFFCYGTGANGKSTFLETVRDLLGESEYARTAAPDLLLSKKQDRHESEIVDLHGARFVTTVEVGEGRSWDESRVKWLTGGDVLSGRPMYGSRISFQPTHKFWLAANHRPFARGVDYGFWRRVHFVPFTVTIPKPEQDPNLRAKIRAELSGVLAWAVRGAVEWQRVGLNPPAAVVDATKAYREAEDVIGAFLDECCVVEPRGRVVVGGLYDEFRKWAERGGERVPSKRSFGDALEDRGFTRERTAAARWFVGLSLKAPDRDNPQG